jgi:hypothetical protein
MEAFIAELRALMAKHQVNLVGHDNYDGEENFAGTDYEFAKGDRTFPVDRIS